jgi:hypothetical protein
VTSREHTVALTFRCKLALPPAGASADLAPATWSFDGRYVHEIVATPQAAYVAGDFTHEQTATGGGALIDPSGAGSNDRTAPVLTSTDASPARI